MAFVAELRRLTPVYDSRSFDVGYEEIFNMLSATPAQTARAAFYAVTARELEAVDE
jgi:hypothetical protein